MLISNIPPERIYIFLISESTLNIEATTLIFTVKASQNHRINFILFILKKMYMIFIISVYI